MPKMIRTEDAKATRKLLLKNSQVKIDTSEIRGMVNLKNFRKYNFTDQVDLEFSGEIYVFFKGKRSWVSTSLLVNENVSKIKVNKFIRKRLYKTLKDYLNFFSVRLNYYTDIKKIKWF